MVTDFTTVTERAGSPLNSEQMERFVHRYAVAAALTNGHTLEVACGAAIGLGSLRASGRKVFGLDYTSAVLGQAQAHYRGRLPLLCADGQQLPVASGSVDALLCLEAIYYFPDPNAFLSEAKRVLARRGRLLVASSNPDWPHFVPGALTSHYPTASELARWLLEAGFHTVRLYGAVAVHRVSRRYAAALRLRRRLLRSRLRPLIAPVAQRLKALVYGKLSRLPVELPLPLLRHTLATLQLEPLSPDAPDHVHRVIYALGEVV